MPTRYLMKFDQNDVVPDNINNNIESAKLRSTTMSPAYRYIEFRGLVDGKYEFLTGSDLVVGPLMRQMRPKNSVEVSEFDNYSMTEESFIETFGEENGAELWRLETYSHEK